MFYCKISQTLNSEDSVCLLKEFYLFTILFPNAGNFSTKVRNRWKFATMTFGWSTSKKECIPEIKGTGFLSHPVYMHRATMREFSTHPFIPCSSWRFPMHKFEHCTKRTSISSGNPRKHFNFPHCSPRRIEIVTELFPSRRFAEGRRRRGGAGTAHRWSRGGASSILVQPVEPVSATSCPRADSLAIQAP